MEKPKACKDCMYIRPLWCNEVNDNEYVGEPSDMDYCGHGKRREDDACWLFKTNDPDNQKGKTALHCSRCGSRITLETDLAPIDRCPACDAKMDTVMAEIENEVMGKLHIPLRAHSVMPYIDVMEVIRRKRE